VIEMVEAARCDLGVARSAKLPARAHLVKSSTRSRSHHILPSRSHQIPRSHTGIREGANKTKVRVSGQGTSTKKARTLVILNISPVTPSIRSLQGTGSAA
jgi:hypothetical protein